MSTKDDAMQPRQRMGVGMESGGRAEMDPEQPDLQTLDPDVQRASMGLPKPSAAMGQQTNAGMPPADEIARREEAAKRGGNS